MCVSLGKTGDGETTHQVESTASLEPLDLSLVERMRQLELVLGPISMLGDEGKVLALGKALESLDIHLIIGLNLVVIGRVDESQREHALLLQVGLVDACERTGNDGQSTEVPRLQSSVFTRGTLAVVVITNDDPLDALVAVGSGDLGDATPFAGELVLDLVGFLVGDVDGADEAVLGDVLEMTAVLEPWSTGGDVVGGYPV